MGWFKDAFHAVVDVHKDITNAVVQTAVAPVSAIAGKDVIDVKMETGFGRKVLNPVVDVVADTNTAVLYQINNPINSILGKSGKPVFRTGVGEVVGGMAVVGNDSVQVLGKSIGDAFTAGYATKAANLIRSDKNQESAFDYSDMKIKSNNKQIAKLEAGIKETSMVVGQIYGSKMASNTQVGQAIGQIAAIENGMSSPDQLYVNPGPSDFTVDESGMFAGDGVFALLGLGVLLMLIFAKKG